MAARTITLYVTGEFDGASDEAIADMLFDVFRDDYYTGPGGPREVLGITLPKEEGEGYDL